MIKCVIVVVMVSTLTFSISALAAESGTGVIEGQLINGTEGGSSVADQDITLKAYRDGVEVAEISAQTDDEGRFVCSGLFAEPDYNYEVSIVFQQAEYNSEWFSFKEGETAKSIQLTVYDSTTSDEAIKVATAHTIIYVGQDSLQVKEYYLFVNEADRTYIGAKEINAEGTRETLRFFLPNGATEVKATLGLMPCCIFSNEDGFVDTMPVLPGAKEVAYSYRVDYSSETYEFFGNVNYPTVNYDFLVQGEGTEVTSDRLTPAGLLDIKGSTFNHFFAQELAVDEVVVIYFSNLPQRESQVSILWLLIVLIVPMGAFAFVYLLRKKRLQPLSAKDSLDRRRKRLLIELAELDDDLESGDISDDVYQRIRTEKKAQLLTLMQKVDVRRANR